MNIYWEGIVILWPRRSYEEEENEEWYIRREEGMQTPGLPFLIIFYGGTTIPSP